MTTKRYTEAEKTRLWNRLDAAGGTAFVQRDRATLAAVEALKAKAAQGDWAAVEAWLAQR